MSDPLVSVIMPAYNHAPFVAQAMESVLAQQGVELELLVEDDGSTDGTPRAIQKVADPRVQSWTKAANEGAGATVNNLIRRAKGEFIALINSDDLWVGTDKLAMQVDVLRSRPEVAACFGHASFIGADGSGLRAEQMYSAEVFAQENRSRGAWLRRFFLAGNCLCHPTILIRRSVYETVGLFDNRLRQIPDLDMWIRVLKRHSIHVIPRELVRFRLREGANTSAPTAANTMRLMNEHLFVISPFFEGMDEATLEEGFGDLLLQRTALRSPQAVEIEKALLFFKGQGALQGVYRTIGLAKVHAFLGDAGYRAPLREYGIDDLWLQREMAAWSPFVSFVEPGSSPPPPGRARPIPLLRYLSFLRR